MTFKDETQAIDLKDDKIEGVTQIAKFIVSNERRTQYLLETGQIPAGKLGRLWIASKKRLREHYENITSGEAA